MSENEVMNENLSYKTIKNIIKGKLNSVAESFVSIGYRLKQVRDGELFKEDGYKDIYEFAKEEYNLSLSNVSRFMAINDKFSENGNSPFLIPEYAGYGSSKLSEMLNLDEEELKLVTEKATVKEIREIKQIRNEAEQSGVFATSQKTEESLDFTQSESDLKQEENKDISNLSNIVIELFRDKNRRELLKELSVLSHKNLSVNDMAQEISELVNPSKHFSFKKGFNMAFFEEKEIKYKAFGGLTIEYTYLDFLNAVDETFDMAAADPWVKYYGEPKPEEKPEETKEPKAEAKASKPEKPKKPEPEKQVQQQEKKPEPPTQTDDSEEVKEEVPGQANINDYPEYAPDNPEIEKVEGEVIQDTIEETSHSEEIPEEKQEESGPKIHDLKTDHIYFADVLREIKPFELRFNDRDYQVGDILRLCECIDKNPTGRNVDREVTYLLQNYPGLQDGYCILGTKPV